MASSFFKLTIDNYNEVVATVGNTEDLPVVYNDYLFSFIPFAVIGSSIPDNPQNVNPNDSITITFSEEVSVPSIQYGTNVILRPLGGGTTVPATASYDNPTKTITIDPNSALQEEVAYEIFISENLQNTSLTNLVADFILPFAVADITPPAVTGVFNRYGESLISGGTLAIHDFIRIDFNDNLTPSTVIPSNVYLEYISGPSVGSNVPAAPPVYDDINKRVILTPSSNLDHGVSVRLRITVEVEDNQGNPLPVEYTADYTVTTDNTFSAASIVSATPSGGSEPVGTNAVITFNENLDPSTADQYQMVLDSDSSVIPSVVTIVNNIVTINPDASLDQGETYRVEILAGARDKNGNEFTGAPYTYTFTTFIDLVPPSLINLVTNSYDPNSGTLPEFTFIMSEDIDPADLNNSNFFVRENSVSSPLPSIVVSAGFNAITIRLNEPLGFSHPYELVISDGVRDLSGNAIVSEIVNTYTTPAFSGTISDTTGLVISPFENFNYFGESAYQVGDTYTLDWDANSSVPNGLQFQGYSIEEFYLSFAPPSSYGGSFPAPNIVSSANNTITYTSRTVGVNNLYYAHRVRAVFTDYRNQQYFSNYTPYLYADAWVAPAGLVIEDVQTAAGQLTIQAKTSTESLEFEISTDLQTPLGQDVFTQAAATPQPSASTTIVAGGSFPNNLAYGTVNYSLVARNAYGETAPINGSAVVAKDVITNNWGNGKTTPINTPSSSKLPGSENLIYVNFSDQVLDLRLDLDFLPPQESVVGFDYSANGLSDPITVVAVNNVAFPGVWTNKLFLTDGSTSAKWDIGSVPPNKTILTGPHLAFQNNQNVLFADNVNNHLVIAGTWTADDIYLDRFYLSSNTWEGFASFSGIKGRIPNGGCACSVAGGTKSYLISEYGGNLNILEYDPSSYNLTSIGTVQNFTAPANFNLVSIDATANYVYIVIGGYTGYCRVIRFDPSNPVQQELRPIHLENLTDTISGPFTAHVHEYSGDVRIVINGGYNGTYDKFAYGTYVGITE